MQILEAIGVLNDLDGRSQVAIRAVLNNAGNALAQTTYRSTVLFDFIDGVQRFFEGNEKESYPQLALAHDKLYANLLAACLINENRQVLEHLLARDLMTEDGSLALNSEALMVFILFDAEQLQSYDLMLDTEQLQGIVLSSSAILQDMGVLQGAEQLSSAAFLSNAQQLSAFTNSLQAFELSSISEFINDATQLGSQAISNAEFLQGSMFYDSATLQGFQQLSSSADLFNAQQINSFIHANQQLSGHQSIQ